MANKKSKSASKNRVTRVKTANVNSKTEAKSKVAAAEASPEVVKAKTVKKVKSELHKEPVEVPFYMRVVQKRKARSAEADDSGNLLGGALAEFFGVFMLAGVALSAAYNPLIIMFSIIGIVLLFAYISGSHLNPAVTIAAWVTQKVGAYRALFYVLAQVLGALAAFAIFGMFQAQHPTPSNDQMSMMGMAQQAPELFKVSDVIGAKTTDAWLVFLAELIGSIVLGLFFAASIRQKVNKVSSSLLSGFGYFIALSLATGMAAFLTVRATILNPALAPIFGAVPLDGKESNWMQFIVYILAPIVGAIVGFYIYDVIRGEETAEVEE